MHDLKQLWDSVLVQIELAVSPATFNMWFKDTRLVSFDEGAVKLGVPNTFVKEWLSTKFHGTILKLLRDLSVSAHTLEYVIVQPAMENEEKKSKKGEDLSLPLSPSINKDDNLNARYTFDSFIIGPFNEMAHAAALAICRKPVSYNPVFIYGNTGLGKTHLMQAVGNYFKSHDNSKRIYYITSEKFAQEMINSMQSGQMNKFKEKYRKYDVFIMDDIQFFSNKEKTQEELFHLFNHLYENNKQIIFSSDRHPNLIPSLESRLRSRFVSGMIVDIPQPDHESRMALFRTKALSNGIELSEDSLNLLASHITGNIREIEGVINSLSMKKQVTGKDPSLLDVKNVLKTSTLPQKAISSKEVVKTIAEFYGVEEESIIDKNRKKEVVKPRQVCMYILRHSLNLSYPEIGKRLGGRDHTTVMHACDSIKTKMELDAVFGEEINQIKTLF